MPNEPTITDLVNARQAELERIKAGSSRAFMARIKPIVDKISKDIRGMETPLTQATIKEVNAILSEVRTELGAAIDASNDELTKDMGGLAVEAQKVEKKDIVGATTVSSSAIQTAKRDKLLRAVFKSPIQATGELVETFQSDFKRSQIKGMNAVIRQGISAGQTNLQIAQSIKGLKSLRYNDGQMAKIERQGVTMVNTVVQHVAATSRHAMYEDNDDVFSGYTWVSTLDSRTSSKCQILDGQKFKTGRGPLPPVHPNAIPRGEKITTINGFKPIEQIQVGDIVLTHKKRFKPVTATMRRQWVENADSIVELIDDLGAVARFSYDHPVLTREGGWQRAKDIKVGDVIFHHLNQLSEVDGLDHSTSVDTILANSNNMKTHRAQRFVPLQITSDAGRVTSAVQLNYYIIKHKIGHVCAYYWLKFVGNIMRIKKLNK